jgi:transcriptional regulator with XRE-family HTH domain
VQAYIRFLYNLVLKMISLKDLRTDLKKTQHEMAMLLGISQPQYNRYEKDPSLLTLALFEKLKPYVDFSRLSEKKAQEFPCLDPGHPYQQFFQKRQYLYEYIEKLPRQEDVDTPEAFTSKKLKEIIFNVARKPNIGLYGKFDAGKTHLVNSLMGGNQFKVRYRPTTSLITFICHLDDKPEWLNESVVLMRKDFNLSYDYTNSEGLWNSQCIYKGNLGVLDEFGSHNGNTDGSGVHENEQYQKIIKEAFYAVVYLDSPILRACNIIDTPGYGSRKHEDTEKAHVARNQIDILLFLTTVSASFDQEDLIELSSLLRQLSRPEKISNKIQPFRNLLFVITRADGSVTSADINWIIESGSKDMLYAFKDSVFGGVDLELIKQRCFPFWSELPQRRDDLFKDIGDLLSVSMPLVIEENTKSTLKELKGYGVKTFEKQITNWGNLIESQSNAQAAYKKLTENKKQKIEELSLDRDRMINFIKTKSLEAQNNFEDGYDSMMSIENIRDRMINFIKTKSLEAQNNFEDGYDSMMSIENISNLLTEAYGKDSKKAQANAGGLINEKLVQLELKAIDEALLDIGEEFDEFLEQSPLTKGPSDSFFIEIPFDTKGAFWGAVSSGVVGGGLIAASAAAGNLGGYALAATGVSWLSGTGISFAATGGTSGVMSMIAALGGPVTIGIAITALTGLAVWRLLGDNWEQRLSKKIIKEFGALDAKSETSSKIKTQVSQLEGMFEKNYIKLQQEYEYYLNLLKTVGNGDTSVSKLEEKIEAAREKKSFFENNSWDAI